MVQNHRIVVSMGDPAGVGFELLLRLLEKKKISFQKRVLKP